jgi:WD40 repeat protein
MKAVLLPLILSLPLRAAPVTALAFSPDGSALVSAGDRCVEVRAAKDGAFQRRSECGMPKLTSLAFSPDARWLAVGGGDPGVSGEARILSWPEGKVIQTLGGHSDLVMAVAFKPDGTQVASASADHSARVWSITGDGGAAERFTLRGHAGPVLGIAFGPESIVTASADRSLKVWSPSDGRLIRSFSHHTEVIHALAFRPGKAECATAGDDRTVRIWQPEVGRMVRIIRKHNGPVFALAWLPDGRALFSAGREGIIRRLDAESDAVQSERTAHDDWIYSLAVSPDGAVLASGDWAGNVRLHDAATTLPLKGAPPGK